MEASSQQPTALVVGVVLAAGAAERMGNAKQLLPYKGAILLQHAVDAAEASRLDGVRVVTGAYADEVEAALRVDRAVTVRNPDFRRGNMSSLEVGAAAAPQADAVMLLMGDHPGVKVAVIDEMLELWRRQRPWAATAAYRDRVAHPFLLSREALDESIQIGGPKLLWRLVAEDQTGRVLQLEVDAPAPDDVNSPEDYRSLLAEGE